MKKLTLAVSLAALAIGGAAYAHNHMAMGDKDITRAEAQAKCAEMFARMDANKDGLLNDADRDARMGQMFDALDTDKNGSISREEFNAAHSGMSGMRHHMGRPDGMTMGHGSMKGHHGRGGMKMQMMKMADKNGDGSVSSAEFTEAHLAMFDKADANKDGTLTSAERKAGMEAMKAQMQAPAEAAHGSGHESHAEAPKK
jgi:Ca2+-binding EF-hand superfamily protein